MKFKILFLVLIFILSSACNKETIIKQDEVEIIEIAGAEFHTTLSSGLEIDIYELESYPTTEPIVFIPIGKQTQSEILAIHEQERKQWFESNSFSDGMKFCMKTEFDEKEFIACEAYITYEEPQFGSLAAASVEVLLDDKVIYISDAGEGSPINPLRGLWNYAESWVLEYAHVSVTLNEDEPINVTTAVGHLVENGVLLNEKYGYDEAFNFQLLAGKPFYFYEKEGQIGISYAGSPTILGFEDVLHYGCCSAGMLNPSHAKNMVAFFAAKEAVWYYVEIGVYE